MFFFGFWDNLSGFNGGRRGKCLTVLTAKGVGVVEYGGAITGSFKALFSPMHPENNTSRTNNIMWYLPKSQSPVFSFTKGFSFLFNVYRKKIFKCGDVKSCDEEKNSENDIQ